MEETNEYLGKHLLVGLTYVNHHGEVTGRLQLHGEITQVSEREIAFERADGGGEFTIPGNFEALQPADPGEYTLTSTGEVVVDPDYTCVWTIRSGPTGEEKPT